MQDSELQFYKIYPSLGGKTFTPLETRRGDRTRFEDFLGASGKSASYRVSAVNSSFDVRGKRDRYSNYFQNNRDIALISYDYSKTRDISRATATMPGAAPLERTRLADGHCRATTTAHSLAPRHWPLSRTRRKNR